MAIGTAILETEPARFHTAEKELNDKKSRKYRTLPPIRENESSWKPCLHTNKLLVGLRNKQYWIA